MVVTCQVKIHKIESIKDFSVTLYVDELDSKENNILSVLNVTQNSADDRHAILSDGITFTVVLFNKFKALGINS